MGFGSLVEVVEVEGVDGTHGTVLFAGTYDRAKTALAANVDCRRRCRLAERKSRKWTALCA